MATQNLKLHISRKSRTGKSEYFYSTHCYYCNLNFFVEKKIEFAELCVVSEVVAPSHDADAGRSTDRLRIGLRELSAPRRQPVNTRRFVKIATFVAVAFKPDIISHDDDHIGFVLRRQTNSV